MLIYVLLRQNYDGGDTACVSENINKIFTSICKYFSNEDYPEFEVWKDGKCVYSVSGNDVMITILTIKEKKQ